MEIVCIVLCLICLYFLIEIDFLDRRMKEVEEDLKIIRGMRILSEMFTSASKEKGEDDGADNSSRL